ncbi:polysaccharide deacetylase family protein [Desulfosporosinus youngiae]|uniref:Putative xylanase/chitin deacetylase n=1 Tax=Desulfosporosinus youngiae DSM 17734 TaxID=768710 RepID=H5Y1W9_9FIRM|nr:putative xylanase/chitin deacetylase [Desulfosporosinus youngiae DSM 17734]
MLKKIIVTLCLIFLIPVLVLGINGCGKEKVSSQTFQAEIETQTETETQAEAIVPSVTLNESTNPESSPILQKPVEVPVLYYHSVMLEEGNEVRMPPDQFEAQMAYMREQGYESVTLDQLYQAFYKGGALPAKPFVITFDDGYEDNYTTAFPILKKHGFTAAVFMVSSYINGEGFLSWSQLKELTANGWEIEGHTANHPYLSKMDKAAVLNELKSSKELIEKELGQTVNYIAYPYGDYNANIVQAVKDTGYLMAFTTERGWSNLNLDEWHLQRVYCFANMGLKEFSRRLQNPKY